MGKIYIAYGSNMNLKQMALRCPTAEKIGIGKVQGYGLLFRGCPANAFATIEPDPDRWVDAVIWEIEETDERSLDRYEGVPTLYQKKMIPVVMDDGKEIEGMAYIMDRRYRFGAPSSYYFSTILEGYRENGIPEEGLLRALVRSHELVNEQKKEPVQKMEM